MRGLRIAGVVLVSLAALAGVWIVGGNMWAAHREQQSDRAWVATFGSLDDLKKKYPTRATNETATRLEQVTRGTVFDLTPAVGSVRSRGVRLGTDWNRSQGMFEFLMAQVAKPEASIDEPPNEATSFLEEKRVVVDAIEALLTTEPPPEWALDVSIPAEDRRMPNVLGQIRIQRILLARALAAAARGDSAAAVRALEASWKLNKALLVRPETLSQIIAVAVSKMEAGALRKIDVPAEIWRTRLEAMGSRSRVVDAIGLEYPRPADLAAQYRHLRPAGVGWWAYNLVSLLEEPRDRLAWADYGEAWARAIAGLRDEPAFRERDSDPKPGGTFASIMVSISIPNIRNSFDRADRLALDAELTGKILQVKAARAATGVWPPPSADLAASRFPGLVWKYTVDGGAMTIALNRELPKPMAGLVLPTSFSSRTPAP